MKKNKRKQNPFYVDFSLNIKRKKPKLSYYGPFKTKWEAEHQIHICLLAAHG